MTSSINKYSIFNSGTVAQYLPALASPFFGLSKLTMPNKTLSIDNANGFFTFNENVEENVLIGAFIPLSQEVIIAAVQMFFNRCNQFIKDNATLQKVGFPNLFPINMLKAIEVKTIVNNNQKPIFNKVLFQMELSINQQYKAVVPDWYIEVDIINDKKIIRLDYHIQPIEKRIPVTSKVNIDDLLSGNIKPATLQDQDGNLIATIPPGGTYTLEVFNEIDGNPPHNNIIFDGNYE